MKKILTSSICFLLLLISSSAISQQFLWTTLKKGGLTKSAIEVISKEQIPKKILNYYEVYNYYYDLSGFTKNEFLRTFETSSWYTYINKSKWVELKSSIDEDMIMCMKFNDGKGSSILVLIFEKDKIDAIIFSDNIFYGGYKNTYHAEIDSYKKRFIKFFESLIGNVKDFTTKTRSESESYWASIGNHNQKGSKDDGILAPTVKKSADRTDEPKIEDYNKLFTVVEIFPEFPGGLPAWLKFLERNLNRDLLSDNGAPTGKYNVIVSFIVDKSGGISEIQAENDPGYGTKEEAVRVIKISPSWKPAVHNGRNVNYLHRQSITFLKD
jgi:hypothetical protein